MKHAILILSSYGYDYLCNMLKQFNNDNDFEIYIHIDNKTLYDMNSMGYTNDNYIDLLKNEFNNIKLVYHKYICKRFSYNMVLGMYDLLLKSYNQSISYYHYMSDSCYLTHSLQYFKNFFNNTEKSFIEYYEMPTYLYNNEIQYKGSQWMSLNKYIVEKIIDNDNISNIIQILRNEFIIFCNNMRQHMINKKEINSNLNITSGAVDEFVFQYIILKDILNNDKSLIEKYICNDNLRYINWNNCTTSPKILKYSEYNDYDINYIKEKSLICRKIDYKNTDSLKFIQYITNEF